MIIVSGKQEPDYDEFTENAEGMNEYFLNEEQKILWEGGRAGMRVKFITGLSNVNRPGIADLVRWLDAKTDFYRAPASANGHNNYTGGLLEHTLKVYYNLLSLTKIQGHTFPGETLLLVAFCHDICKANFYKETTRNVKDDITGRWYQEPYFSIEDQIPLGHGEKSVIILQKFVKLTCEEIMAIRWHMGGFDDSARSYAGGLALTNAFKKYPLCSLLHIADLLACYPEEQKGES